MTYAPLSSHGDRIIGLAVALTPRMNTRRRGRAARDDGVRARVLDVVRAVELDDRTGRQRIRNRLARARGCAVRIRGIGRGRPASRQRNRSRQSGWSRDDGTAVLSSKTPNEGMGTPIGGVHCAWTGSTRAKKTRATLAIILVRLISAPEHAAVPVRALCADEEADEKVELFNVGGA